MTPTETQALALLVLQSWVEKSGQQLLIPESYDWRSKIFKNNSVIQSQNRTKSFSGLFLSKVALCWWLNPINSKQQASL